ncbi:MAG: hypothetical protein RRC07_05770 [Anaerolineae bacterium]|nr:hypothetical protein [Anaerolineae bacterium]
MARKVRRVKPAAPAESAKPNNKVAAKGATTDDTLREQYTYVIKDLRRVFVLAAVMFLLLIALNILL